jgi:hypothetical protein
MTPVAAKARPRSRIRALLARTDRAITLNVALLTLLAIWLVAELAIEGTAYTLVAVVPAAPFFARAVYAVRTGKETSWLSASGAICALLAVLCAASFYESLAITPVDVSCAVSSALFGVIFVYGAGYQLLRGARG